MADYAPPPGPPPPQVPIGWKAVWSNEYKTWFFVNLLADGQPSTWEQPTEPAQPSGGPSRGPPGYDHDSSHSGYPQEKGALSSNNPYASSGYGSSGNMNAESDEAMARRLQAEEQTRMGNAGSSRGAQDQYYGGGPSQPSYGQPSPSPYGTQQLPPREEGGKKGLFSKISSKLGGSSSSRPQQYGGGGYGGGGYGYPQQGYPPQRFGQPHGYGPGPGYGGYPMHGGGMYGQPPRRGGGGGMGMAGGAALGLGAGVLGGAVLANSMDDDDYQEGYEDGADDAGGDDGGGE